MNRDMVGFAYPPSESWEVTRENIELLVIAIVMVVMVALSGCATPPRTSIAVSVEESPPWDHGPTVRIDGDGRPQ